MWAKSKSFTIFGAIIFSLLSLRASADEISYSNSSTNLTYFSGNEDF